MVKSAINTDTGIVPYVHKLIFRPARHLFVNPFRMLRDRRRTGGQDAVIGDEAIGRRAPSAGRAGQLMDCRLRRASPPA